MSNEKVSMSELLTLSDSGVWGSTAENDGISILRSTNIQVDGEISFDNLAIKEVTEKDRSRKMLFPGDILVEKSGGGPRQPVGRVAFFRGSAQPHVFGNFIARLRVKPKLCDPRFLFWFLYVGHQRGNTENFQKQTTGIRNLEFKRFLSQELTLPSLDKQRRIAGLLDRAAEIRRRADAARAKARAVVPSLFVDAFGDPATNPKGWPIVTVGHLLESAAYGTSKKANDRCDGIPMIRMGNVTSGGQLDTADLKHIDIGGEERKKAELLEGDLLFNRTNSKELVGKTGIWDGRFEAVAASYFIRLRVKRDLCSPSYLWAYFNTRFMKRNLFDTARGAIGQANINAKELRAFRVAAPPLALQIAFAEQVHRLELLARHLDTVAAKAEVMAASLSAEVFPQP